VRNVILATKLKDPSAFDPKVSPFHYPLYSLPGFRHEHMSHLPRLYHASVEPG
jgi:hypothetical protein